MNIKSHAGGFTWIVNKTPQDHLIENVCTVVCEKYDITLEELKSDSHKRGVQDPKHICFYILVDIYNLGNANIARKFDMEQSTVRKARDKVKGLIDSDSSLSNFITECFIAC